MSVQVGTLDAVAAGFGVLTGRITANAQVSTFRGVRVAVVERASGRVVRVPKAVPAVADDGTFRVGQVPVGAWGLVCNPAAGTALACLTYPDLVGIDLVHGTDIMVTAGTKTDIELTLQPAGYVQAFVTAGDTGLPLSGAAVLTYESSSRQAFAVAPVLTDDDGQALISNVPLRCRVAVVGPVGYRLVRVDAADGTKVLKIGNRGDVLRVAVTVGRK